MILILYSFHGFNQFYVVRLGFLKSLFSLQALQTLIYWSIQQSILEHLAIAAGAEPYSLSQRILRFYFPKFSQSWGQGIPLKYVTSSR